LLGGGGSNKSKNEDDGTESTLSWFVHGDHPYIFVDAILPSLVIRDAGERTREHCAGGTSIFALIPEGWERGGNLQDPPQAENASSRAGKW
jgi:hypothetical protein